jgi:hypothetical protein
MYVPVIDTVLVQALQERRYSRLFAVHVERVNELAPVRGKFEVEAVKPDRDGAIGFWR